MVDSLFEFPDSFIDPELEEIKEFRRMIIDEYPQLIRDWRPDHYKLHYSIWPFRFDANRDKDLNSVNDHYYQLYLTNSIYCNPDLPEFDERLTRAFTEILVSRGRGHLYDLPLAKQRRALLLPKEINYTSFNMRYLLNDCWPLPGRYQSKHFSRIPSPILASTLATNYFSHPLHPLFNRKLAQRIIQEIKERRDVSN